MTDTPGRPDRWRLRFSEFEFQDVHLFSVKQQATDVSSRLATTEMDKSPLDDDLPVLMIAEAQSEHEILKHTQICAYFLR